MFESYRALLRRTDALSERLYRRHARHVQCRRGCYYCCTNITVTPIEFAWVGAAIAELRRTGDSIRALGPDSDVPRVPEHDEFAARIPDDSDLTDARNTRRCALLRDGVCSVYHARPLICRVHGLPLAYPVLEYGSDGRRIVADDPEVALVWCDLNFRDYDMLSTASSKDIVSMGEMYADLEAVNERFLETDAGKAFAQAGQVDLDEVLRLPPQ